MVLSFSRRASKKCGYLLQSLCNLPPLLIYKKKDFSTSFHATSKYIIIIFSNPILDTSIEVVRKNAQRLPTNFAVVFTTWTKQW
jgi:hypothetical protein